MFCADRSWNLAIVDWSLIGVDRLQRYDFWTKKIYEFTINIRSLCVIVMSLKPVDTNQWPINDRQNPWSVCTKRVTRVHQTLFFPTPTQKKIAVWPHKTNKYIQYAKMTGPLVTWNTQSSFLLWFLLLKTIFLYEMSFYQNPAIYCNTLKRNTALTHIVSPLV